MTRSVERPASRWALTALGVLAPYQFAQIDLDQLLPTWRAESVLDTSIDAFLAVQDVLRADGRDLIAAVVFPLPPTAGLTDAPAALEDWPLSVDLAFNVPGLYIAPPDAFADFRAAEDYRIALTMVDPRLSDTVSYYRASRTESDAQRGWEYSRAIYVLTPPAIAIGEAQIAF